MKIKDHVHKYMRVYIGGRKVEKIDGKKVIVKKPAYEVYKCQVPGCPTYKPRELVINERSICWNCGEEMVLDPDSLKLKKPTHTWCRRIRERIA